MKIERFRDSVLVELDGSESHEDILRVLAEEQDRWWTEVGPAIEAYHRFLRSTERAKNETTATRINEATMDTRVVCAPKNRPDSTVI